MRFSYSFHLCACSVCSVCSAVCIFAIYANGQNDVSFVYDADAVCIFGADGDYDDDDTDEYVYVFYACDGAIDVEHDVFFDERVF